MHFLLSSVVLNCLIDTNERTTRSHTTVESVRLKTIKCGRDRNHSKWNQKEVEEEEEVWKNAINRPIDQIRLIETWSECWLEGRNEKERFFVSRKKSIFKKNKIHYGNRIRKKERSLNWEEKMTKKITMVLTRMLTKLVDNNCDVGNNNKDWQMMMVMMMIKIMIKLLN